MSPVASSADTTAASESLSVKKLSCWYGAQQVVWDVDLNIPLRAGVALVGRNGVGKTTLLRGISGAFGVKTAGQVLVGETDLAGWAPEKIAGQGVALVPHDRRIFPLTVQENLKLGARGASDWAARAETMLGYFPLLKPKLRQRGDTLSGGEQQALAIARAMMGSPRYLLLDEPAEGLAPSLVDQLIEALLALRQGSEIGILLVDRNPDLISELCSQVHGMSKGRINRRATASEFSASEDLRAQFLAPTQDDPTPLQETHP